MVTKINTKFGDARIGNQGYYVIAENSKGYYGKLLHRLLFEDYYNVCLLEEAIIHHIDENKLNNSIENLELMDRHSHVSLHFSGENNPMYGKHLSEETKQKISNTLKGRELPKETRVKIIDAHTNRFVNNDKSIHLRGERTLEECIANSKRQNTSGYFRVTKGKNSACKQGFTWCYKYYDENGKQQNITCVDIDKLKQKVLSKGLEWIDYGEKYAEN